jgi:V-type H+-transporting ATPase proteolipid subunit
MMPPIMASIVSIYGLVIAVIISNALKEKLALFTGFIQLGAGISVGISGLATGYVGSSLPSRQRTTM